MGLNKLFIIIYIALFIFVISACFPVKDSKLSQMNQTLKYSKSMFCKDYNNDKLLSHFPDNINDDVISLYSYPPSCLPSFECRAQDGDMFLLCKFDSLNPILFKNVLFKTEYLNDSNIIINTRELKRDVFPIEKCNQWYLNKYPLPYFERFDFDLGKKKETKVIDGETHIDYIHNIPTDLIVFVYQAESGDFWKESCKEKRPDSLKEWKQGYSKGIAISKKENILVYWAMMW